MVERRITILTSLTDKELEDLVIQQTQVGYGPALRMLKREASRRHQEALRQRRFNRATLPMYRR